jgi:holo-[acyl-carrier protein] synthase
MRSLEPERKRRPRIERRRDSVGLLSGSAGRAQGPAPTGEGWRAQGNTAAGEGGQILSVGVDLVELDRIRRVMADHGERFLVRIYTAAERARYRDRLPELAVRFAAKEAVAKALGVGLNHMSSHGIGWQEVEVLPDPLGKPEVYLSGRAQALAAEKGLHTWAISLSHGRDQAIAFVVATGRG